MWSFHTSQQREEMQYCQKSSYTEGLAFSWNTFCEGSHRGNPSLCTHWWDIQSRLLPRSEFTFGMFGVSHVKNCEILPPPSDHKNWMLWFISFSPPLFNLRKWEKTSLLFFIKIFKYVANNHWWRYQSTCTHWFSCSASTPYIWVDDIAQAFTLIPLAWERMPMLIS